MASENAPASCEFKSNHDIHGPKPPVNQETPQHMKTMKVTLANTLLSLLLSLMAVKAQSTTWNFVISPL